MGLIPQGFVRSCSLIQKKVMEMVSKRFSSRHKTRVTIRVRPHQAERRPGKAVRPDVRPDVQPEVRPNARPGLGLARPNSSFTHSSYRVTRNLKKESKNFSKIFEEISKTFRSFRSFANFSNFSLRRCHCFGPQIVKIRAIPAIFMVV